MATQYWVGQETVVKSKQCKRVDPLSRTGLLVQKRQPGNKGRAQRSKDIGVIKQLGMCCRNKAACFNQQLIECSQDSAVVGYPGLSLRMRNRGDPSACRADPQNHHQDSAHQNRSRRYACERGVAGCGTPGILGLQGGRRGATHGLAGPLSACCVVRTRPWITLPQQSTLKKQMRRQTG